MSLPGGVSPAETLRLRELPLRVDLVLEALEEGVSRLLTRDPGVMLGVHRVGRQAGPLRPLLRS